MVFVSSFFRHITLDIGLGTGASVVTSELDLERNAARPGEDLFLDGEELKLFRVYVRGEDGSVVMLKVTLAAQPHQRCRTARGGTGLLGPLQQNRNVVRMKCA